MNDAQYMLRALELAENGSGFVSPNPKVGAVIVKEGYIIGEGWHTKFGAPHAEVEAIRNAELDDFAGCTIYVNLEPCSHFGKTPPCTDLIIEKNFSRVVIGMKDPNPIVSGSGIEKLRQAGIEVITDVCYEQAEWSNRIFNKYIKSQAPYVMIKIGQTLDGCIALNNGESKWITSEESRLRTHLLRHEFDAVLVGRNTILKDNPLLTVRSVTGRNPLRVLCDTNLKSPLDLSLFKLDDNNHTVICCSEEASKTRKARNLSLSGVNILPINLDEKGKMSLQHIISSLKEKFNISSIMIEGGAGIYSSFITSGLVDEIQVFIAPKIFGKCLNAFNNIEIPKIANSIDFILRSLDQSGPDIHAIYVRDNSQQNNIK